MARRRKTSAAHDVVELVSMLPWWAGLVAALVAYLGLHAWAVALAAEVDAYPTMTNALLRGLAYVSQFGVPVLCLLGAAMSARRRSLRKRPARSDPQSSLPPA